MILGTWQRPSANERKQEAWLAAGAAPSQFYLSHFSTHLDAHSVSSPPVFCFFLLFILPSNFSSLCGTLCVLCVRIAPLIPPPPTAHCMQRHPAERGRITINRRRLAKSQVKSVVDSRQVHNNKLVPR